MKAKAAILALTVAACAHAGEVKRPPHITGEQLIAALRGDARFFARPFVLGYIAGVADATQGRGWCLPQDLNPESGDRQVLDKLATRRDAVMQSFASSVLVEQYRVAFPSVGNTCRVRARLTGNQYVDWAAAIHRKSGAEKFNPSPEEQEHEVFTDGYVGGVVDATQGTDWCPDRRIKPDELDAIGYWGVVDQPAGSLPDNAATLLHEVFIAKYPCHSKR